MCGIIGYTGSEKALPRLIDGLYALEYRGYDSAGIAFFAENGIDIIKTKGRIDILKEKVDTYSKPIDALCGIGHTRWATHGEPSDANSHPHGTERTQIVHNGIIENYAELKVFLEDKGYTFYSQTDTEVAAKLIDYFYALTADPVASIRKATDMFNGSYAIAVLFANIEGTIFTVRKDNPLLIALSDSGNFIASDISAVLGYTKKFIRPDDCEIGIVKTDSVVIYSKEDNIVEKPVETASWNKEEAQKGGYPFFMIKEINDEPDSIIKTLRPRIKDGMPDFDTELLSYENIRKFHQIHIVACGTAYHAGLIGKYAIEKLARVKVDVQLASEFRYCDPILNKEDLVIIISQSGETADTLAALRLAKSQGVKVLGIVNVAGSTIAKESDSVIYTWAGPEISVASTKAYCVQMVVLYLLALHIAYANGKIDASFVTEVTKKLLNDVPSAIAETITRAENCSNIAQKYKNHKSMFFIGRGADWYSCCESALKSKEISYIQCEAYAAGELKHGTISLITEGTPVFAIVNVSDLVEKMISNIREVKSRGADLIIISRDSIEFPDDLADHVLRTADVGEFLQPIVTATEIQLLAYYLSLHLGLDVDRPRNLAKSVTVE